MSVRRPLAPWSVLLAVALLALTALAAPVAGFQGTVHRVDTAVTETVTLPIDNWTAYFFEMNAGDVIDYDIRVTVGSPIDVYIVPDIGLADYANHTKVQFLEYLDFNNQRTVTGRFGSAAGGVGFIVDNTNVTQGGADPTGPVTVALHLEKSSNLYLGGLIFLGCGVGLLAAAVVVALVLQRKKAAAAQPVPYGPPPTPYETASGSPPTAASNPPTEGLPPSPPSNP